MSEVTKNKMHTVNVAIFCGLLLIGGIASLAMKKETVSVLVTGSIVVVPLLLPYFSMEKQANSLILVVPATVILLSASIAYSIV